MTKIPEGWAESAIPQIAEVLDTKRIPINSDERAARVAGKPQNSLVAYYGATGQVGWIDTHLFDEDLVLLGEDGVPFLDPGKPKAYRVSGKSWVNNHAHVLRARQDALDWRLLEAQLNTLNYTGHVTGSTRLKLTQGAMNKLPILVPPLAEQKRIADKLDTVLTRVDAVNTRLARVAPLLKRFRQSVLAAATSGRLTEDWRLSRQKTERSWLSKKISDLAEIIDPHPSHRTPAEVADGVPYISIGDVDAKGEIDFENARKVSFDVYREHQQRYHVKEGDFIFGKIGTIGKPTRLPVGVSYTVSANVLLIQPNVNSINPEFARQLFSSPEFMRTVMDASTATSQAAFGIKKMRNTVVNVPSIEEQSEIVRRVETLFAFADRLEARLAHAQTAATRLTPALLAKAFRGELVPQDPNDEPAAELLRRLAQAPAAASPRRGRKAAGAAV